MLVLQERLCTRRVGVLMSWFRKCQLTSTHTLRNGCGDRTDMSIEGSASRLSSRTSSTNLCGLFPGTAPRIAFFLLVLSGLLAVVLILNSSLLLFIFV